MLSSHDSITVALPLLLFKGYESIMLHGGLAVNRQGGGP